MENKEKLNERMSKKGKEGLNQIIEAGEDDGSGVSDEKLDLLWENIRNFLNDTFTRNVGNSKREETSRKVQFEKTCSIYDRKSTGVISKKDLIYAFTSARIHEAEFQ